MDGGLIYALDAGGTFLKSCLFTPDLRPVEGTRDAEPADSQNGTPDQIRGAYRALAERAKARAAALGTSVAAVGMDTPGPFEYGTGTFRMTHKYAALYGVSVLPWFAEDFPGVPVRILHDSAAFILGACRDLPDADRRNVAGVMLGTGLGFALREQGEVLYREDGGPRVSIYARPFRGVTAEEYISARGIVKVYRELCASVTTPAPAANALDVALLAKAGNARAIQAYAAVGAMLGELLCPILAERCTDTLIVGGQVSRDFALFAAPLRAVLSSVPSLSPDRILPAADPGTVHLVGAACAALRS